VSSGVGLEKASAIPSKYPSPAELVRAYSMCGSTKECEDLLASLEVRRTDNILGGTRKVGPDISRRIYLVMTENNPNAFLSKK
jgi:crossover junction endonuclease EME1